jgi:long-chain acyl-CoA synthetase
MATLADIISPESARTLDGLFAERVKRSSSAVAYMAFDDATGRWKSYTWREIEETAGRWQAALEREGLARGDRVAIMLRNSIWWVVFDQAAMGLDLVTVPLYTSDRPDNCAYILRDAGAKVLLLENEEAWKGFSEVNEQLPDLKRVVSINAVKSTRDARLVDVARWVDKEPRALKHVNTDGSKLASIIYTSGTTGRPKGVMLSHDNMLSNAYATLQCVSPSSEDVFLSFLPLSHTLERTGGYYLTIMCGAQVAFARSVQQLAEDLLTIRPTLLISVPRIYERVHAAIKQKLAEGPPARRKLFEFAVETGWARFEHSQGRGPWKATFLLWPVLKKLVASKVMARLGGRLRISVSGGAALSPDISRLFIGLGLPVLQGYGLTETSPVVSANRVEDNVPASIGKPIPGVQVRIGERDALLVKGPNVMLGYWNNPDATKAMFTPDGWLNTGDTARIDSEGRIYITGRLKEIIVMSNGEKVPPVDMEAAIMRDPLFEQIMVLGEGKPFLSVFAVLNKEQWTKVAVEKGIDPTSDSALRGPQAEKMALERIQAQLKEFPGYAQVYRVAILPQPWTIENGLLTPTMKIKRTKVMEAHKRELDSLYAGH